MGGGGRLVGEVCGGVHGRVGGGFGLVEEGCERISGEKERKRTGRTHGGVWLVDLMRRIENDGPVTHSLVVSRFILGASEAGP